MRRLTKLQGRAIIAVCSLVMLVGCDESIDSAPPIKSITATSYNLGLALNFVP